MTNSIKNRLAELAKEWLWKGENFTQSELARLTGLNRTNISHIVSDKWEDKTISDAQWRKLMIFFKQELHIDSYNFRTIQAACQRMKEDATRMGIDGYTGAGKTYALKYFERNHSEVFRIECDEVIGKRGLVLELCDALGVEGQNRNTRKLLKEVIAKVERLNQPLIIFDECEYLNYSGLRMLKTIIQRMEDKCGIVVCGIIKDWLLRMSERGKPGIPQLVRRIGHTWLEMREISTREIRKFCKESSIEDEGCLQCFIRDCKDYDALQRRVRDLLRYMEKTGDKATASMYATLFMTS